MVSNDTHPSQNTIHGSTVIKHALLPVGQLSEDTAEARNKHFRLSRQNYARNFSTREACNREVINILLLTPDPILAEIRPTSRNKYKTISDKAAEMLLSAELILRVDNEPPSDEEVSPVETDASSDEEP